MTLGLPALALGTTRAAWFSTDGELELLSFAEAARRATETPPLLCHLRLAARRLGLDRLVAYDLLELFAFVHPTRFCLPTPRGLARVLELNEPRGIEDEAISLDGAAAALLEQAAIGQIDQHSDPLALTRLMTEAGWSWGPMLLHAMMAPAASPDRGRAALQVWRRLPEWEDEAPPTPPGQQSVDSGAARARLAEMTGAYLVGMPTEPRPSQADYASAVSLAFSPREAPDTPTMVLAEAGTGVGKTLGYLAPATLWAERNQAPVWISTYTRNLQHQIDGELRRRWPDPVQRAQKVVLRKGRENYLCLLNYEDAVRNAAANPQVIPALGLVARWVAATRDGDLGGDLPGWLVDLVGRPRLTGLADRRGECIYGACDHYRRCFIERSVRRARHADIVVANHALVMVQAARGTDTGDTALPQRYVFDEGHHLFDAADSAFAGHLTAQETAELRRWLIGAENARSSRARGLRRRVEDLVADDAESQRALDAINQAARALPGEGWWARIGDGVANGATEEFLQAVRAQVRARADNADGPYGLEAETTPATDAVVETAIALEKSMAALQHPMETLAKRLRARLDDEAEELDGDLRRRLDSVASGVERRARESVTTWRAMLGGLGSATPEGFVDWFGIERQEGRDFDVGYYRHWIDPTIPFVRAMQSPAHGMVVTSATLTDGENDQQEIDWSAAEQRTGALHMPSPAIRARVPSPFDYPAQTRVLIVDDVRKDDLDQVAAAYRSLFVAAGGGALGLFTAVSRLRAVHQRIAPAMETADLPLLAQHVDGLDVQTLVEIFRGEGDACLLGTDAVRDGVDVPGRALRLIVFDRVPWPRPDILHRTRRAAFGGKAYDDRTTRLRLRQAFGRLVRRSDDSGVFVLLDPSLPTRLRAAFPPGVEIRRVGLAEAVRATRDFLQPPGQSISDE